MASIFSKIAAGEIPSYKIAEDENFYAFLDINPVAKGHTLVIPRHEIDYIFDLNAEEYTAFWNFAHKVATAMKAVMPCKRIGVAVMGLEVPHAHIHLIPINKESDMNFFAGKLTLEDSEMAEIAKKINDEFCKENGK
ncbi:MAG: HIT family protein [Sodaliphilus sp.]|nr:HIT family protein [Sodaliphilus sp.]